MKESASSLAPRHSVVRVIIKWLGIVELSVVGLALISLCALSLWLNPERLTELINREASQYLNAEIRATDVDYTLWSSFPRFRISTDSIVVRSRTLDSVSPAIRRELPANADFLGSVKSFSGSINVVDLFIGRYVIHDVKAEGLRINLVAVNDSVNNYNIVPSSGQHLKKVPYFRAHLVSLRDPGGIDYVSLATDTKASLDLKGLTIKELHKNTYALALEGDVTARSSGIDILHDFPFALDGDVKLRFDPFGFSLSDYHINLGALHSRLSMSFGMGEDPRVESFEYNISKVNLLSLLGYIPREYIPSLQGLDADMEVEASARLLSAWSLSSPSLPSIGIDFTVPAGEISYTLSQAPPAGSPAPADSLGSAPPAPPVKTYVVAHSPIRGRFVFDGPDPARSSVTVDPFTLSSSGMDVTVDARLTRLTSSPLIDANVGIRADLSQAMSVIPGGSPAKISGHLSSASRLTFSISDFSREALAKGLDDVEVNTDMRISGLHVSAPGGLDLKAASMRLNASAAADALTPEALCHPSSDVIISLAAATVSVPDAGEIKIADSRTIINADIDRDLSPADFSDGLPLSMRTSARSVSYESGSGDDFLRLAVDNLAVKDVASRASVTSFSRMLRDGLDFSASTAVVTTSRDSLRLNGIDMSLAVAPRPGVRSYRLSDPSAPRLRLTHASDCDRSLPHTPELIEVTIPAPLRSALDRWSLHTDLRVASADLHTPGIDQKGILRDLDFSLDEDSVTLRRLYLNAEGMHASVAGAVTNLRPFLLSAPSETCPLKLALTADVDHININALAKAYAESVGGIDHISTSHPATRADSVAVMVPRNIEADIHARVGEISYTNLHLTDVGADIRVARGIADVAHVGLASSFGKGALSLKYDTSDIESMKASGYVALEDVDIVKFFKKFHSLLEMAPEMSNLTGFIGISADFSGDIFPDMSVNVPSANVDMLLTGRHLKVHQSHFIRRITKMMLIRTDNDIHIRNLNVRASIHDNLVQLYPFDFSFDRYRLHMLGVNNFNGRLYYHLAVEESPLHIPFAINIEGMFSKPKLRFGGVHYDIKRGEEVTERDQQQEAFNLVRLMRDFMGAFVRKAAETPTSSH